MKLKMLPDKIYVREYPDGIARFWESKKKEDVVATIPHEYIRKDALLEWAKQKQYDSETIVQDDFWQEVIDKLNEM